MARDLLSKPQNRVQSKRQGIANGIMVIMAPSPRTDLGTPP